MSKKDTHLFTMKAIPNMYDIMPKQNVTKPFEANHRKHSMLSKIYACMSVQLVMAKHKKFNSEKHQIIKN